MNDLVNKRVIFRWRFSFELKWTRSEQEAINDGGSVWYARVGTAGPVFVVELPLSSLVGHPTRGHIVRARVLLSGLFALTVPKDIRLSELRLRAGGIRRLQLPDRFRRRPAARW